MQSQPFSGTGESNHLHCSFCGKDSDHVRFLTAGVSGGTICDVCCLKALLIFLKAHVSSALGFATS